MLTESIQLSSIRDIFGNAWRCADYGNARLSWLVESGVRSRVVLRFICLSIFMHESAIGYGLHPLLLEVAMAVLIFQSQNPVTVPHKEVACHGHHNIFKSTSSLKSRDVA